MSRCRRLVFEKIAPKTEGPGEKVARALGVQLAVLNRWKSTGCRRSEIRVLTLCASTLQKVFRCLHQQKMLPTVTQEKRGVGGDPEALVVAGDPETRGVLSVTQKPELNGMAQEPEKVRSVRCVPRSKKAGSEYVPHTPTTRGWTQG